VKRAGITAAAALSAMTGLGLFGGQLYLDAKARLADHLLARALAATLAEGRAQRPWPGADLKVLGALELPGQDLLRPVLSGAGGGSLAFGAGHVSGSALPGEYGRCAIAGHRDRAFRCLSRLVLGDEVKLRAPGGTRSYRVVGHSVVDESETWVTEPLLGDGLTLITCWPFGALRPGPKRYVVFCEPDAEI
jgi:sortase A